MEGENKKIKMFQGRARADRTVTNRFAARPRDGMGREGWLVAPAKRAGRRRDGPCAWTGAEGVPRAVPCVGFLLETRVGPRGSRPQSARDRSGPGESASRSRTGRPARLDSSVLLRQVRLRAYALRRVCESFFFHGRTAGSGQWRRLFFSTNIEPIILRRS